MIGPIVSVFSSRCYRPRFVFRFLVQLARVLYAIKGRKLVFDAKRFERAAWISSFRENKPGSFEKSLELVVVSASKATAGCSAIFCSTGAGTSSLLLASHISADDVEMYVGNNRDVTLALCAFSSSSTQSTCIDTVSLHSYQIGIDMAAL